LESRASETERRKAVDLYLGETTSNIEALFDVVEFRFNN
jgi:hypothetical protein